MRYSLKVKWHRKPSNIEKAIVERYFDHDMSANNRQFLLDQSKVIMQTLRNIASLTVVEN